MIVFASAVDLSAVRRADSRLSTRGATNNPTKMIPRMILATRLPLIWTVRSAMHSGKPEELHNECDSSASRRDADDKPTHPRARPAASYIRSWRDKAAAVRSWRRL